MNMKKSCSRIRPGGFTLIELLVVIAIIGLLSTLAAFAVNIAREKARTAKAQSDIDEIYKALSMLAVDTGEWPGHQEYNTVCTDLPGGCPASNELCGPDASSDTCAGGSLSDDVSGLTQDDATDPYPGWAGPYMFNMPVDPWGHEYYFDTDYRIDPDLQPLDCSGVLLGDAVVVGSYGPDGESVPSGTYGCDDIIKILAQ